MEVTFYTFDKRINSTAKPSGGTSVGVYLKDASDVTAPTLELNVDNPTAWNYAGLFNRYYYVREWRSVANNLWQCDLVEDVLASWIDSVKGQSVYASMSSGHYDANINDNRIVPIQTFTPTVTRVAIDVIAPQPSYFVNVVDADSPTGNTVFFGTAVSAFIEEALNTTWYEDLFDKVRGFNPLDMINEAYLCGLLPSACHEVDGGHTADFGTLFDTVTISGSRINYQNSKPIAWLYSLTPPSPQYTDFRRSGRFCKYYLHLPYVGVITVPTELIFPSPTTVVGVNVDVAGDCISGALVYSVRVGTTSIGEYGASLKTPIALSRQTSHTAEVVAGALEIVGGAVVTAAGVPLGAGAIAKGIGDVAQGISPADISKVGSVGSALAPTALPMNANIQLELVEYKSNNEPSTLNATSGRPTHKVVSISGGYYQCIGASVSFAGLEKELSQFNSALNSGVYVE